MNPRYEVRPYGPGTQQVAITENGHWIAAALSPAVGERIVAGLEALETADLAVLAAASAPDESHASGRVPRGDAGGFSPFDEFRGTPEEHAAADARATARTEQTLRDAAARSPTPHYHLADVYDLPNPPRVGGVTYTHEAWFRGVSDTGLETAEPVASDAAPPLGPVLVKFDFDNDTIIFAARGVEPVIHTSFAFVHSIP